MEEIRDILATTKKKLIALQDENENLKRDLEISREETAQARSYAEYFLGYAQDRDPDASVPWEKS